MSECFVLSALVKKQDLSVTELLRRLKNAFYVSDGLFDKRLLFTNRLFNPVSNATLLIYDDQECDFVEVSVSIEGLYFQRALVNKQVAALTEACLELQSITESFLIVGSYEINAFVLSSVRSVCELSEELLKKFPLVLRATPAGGWTVRFDPKAQHLLTD